MPGAICFDLLNGGDKAWGRFPPYRDLGYARSRCGPPARSPSEAPAPAVGATTANFKGGIGSASAATTDGVMVAALAVCQCGRQRDRRRRSVVLGGAVRDRRRIWPSWPAGVVHAPDMLAARLKGGPVATAAENTTLVVVVTDAILTKPQARRLAMIAQTGMARAIYPVHAPLDGDVVFAAATGEKPIDPLFGLTELGMIAANTVARAIARGVYLADALPFPDALPSWKQRFG